MSVVESARRGGIRLWFAVLAGIGAWTVHLLTLASVARFACTEPAMIWVMHGVTVVTVLVTLLAMRLCVTTIRVSADDEDAATVSGNTRFLGVFGLMTGAISLALIVLEGTYVLFLSPCG